MRCPHTTFARGKFIRIVFKGGQVWVVRFHDKQSKSIRVLDHANTKITIPIATLRSATIYREKLKFECPKCGYMMKTDDKYGCANCHGDGLK